MPRVATISSSRSASFSWSLRRSPRERAAVSSNQPAFLFEQPLQVIECLVKFWGLNVADFTIFRGTANDIHGPSRVHRREIVRRGREQMIDGQFSQKTTGQFREGLIVKDQKGIGHRRN